MRPKESEVVMQRVSKPNCKDCDFCTLNGLVHVTNVTGDFLKSGRIKVGDICLSINGIPTYDALTATKVLSEGSPGVIIMLFFRFSRLRCSLMKRICPANLSFSWTHNFNESTCTFLAGNTQRKFRFYNDGNCEDITKSAEKISSNLKAEMESFLSSFYDEFQMSIGALRQAMKKVTIDSA